MKTFKLKTEYGNYDNCILQIDEYAAGGLYVGVFSLDEGPIADCSVWVEGTPFLEGKQFFSKTYDFVPETMKALEKLGIVKKVDGLMWHQGFGSYQAYELCDGYEAYT